MPRVKTATSCQLLKPNMACARRNALSRSGERKKTQAKLTARNVIRTDNARRLQRITGVRDTSSREPGSHRETKARHRWFSDR